MTSPLIKYQIRIWPIQPLLVVAKHGHLNQTLQSMMDGATNIPLHEKAKNDDWPSWLFTLGHFGKGTVYFIAGGLALATVLGAAREPSGPKDVIQFVNSQPFGQILLVVLAIGLFCYLGWRWYKSIADPFNAGTETKGLVKRIAWLCSGTFYGLLAVYALSIVFGAIGNISGGGSKDSAVGKLLSQPFGEVLVYLLAVIFLGTAIYQLIRGLKEKFLDKINKSQLGSKKYDVYRKLGKAGHIARSIIFAIISYFLFRAAQASDASQVRGMEGALEYLQNHQYGFWLLGLMGIGMMMYGGFMFVKARYHQAAQ